MFEPSGKIQQNNRHFWNLNSNNQEGKHLFDMQP